MQPQHMHHHHNPTNPSVRAIPLNHDVFHAPHHDGPPFLNLCVEGFIGLAEVFWICVDEGVNGFKMVSLGEGEERKD